MSALLMGRAMYVPLDMASRLVLVALADHANDDGTEARPGLRRLQIKTGLSRRAVQDCLAHLEGHDLIEAAGYRKGGHGRTTNWKIDPLALRFFSDWYEDDPNSYELALQTVQEDHSSTVQEMHPSDKNSAALHRKQCSVTQLTVQRGAPQPSKTIKNPADFDFANLPVLEPGESRWDQALRLSKGL